jgi:hypothetical protein
MADLEHAELVVMRAGGAAPQQSKSGSGEGTNRVQEGNSLKLKVRRRRESSTTKIGMAKVELVEPGAKR